MSAKRSITFLALLLCGGLVFFLALKNREPRYAGKSLSQWLRGLEYENVNPTADQRRALRAMGAPAVNELIQMLEHRDSYLKRAFVAYAEKHPDIHNRFIAPRYVIPEDLAHSRAATALGEIGLAAEKAVSALLVAGSNRDMIVATRAQAALLKIRGGSIEPLLDDLADLRSTNWTRAAQTAKFLGTNAQVAVPLLVKALQDTNLIVRENAANALFGIASRPEITIPALIDCVTRETNASVRRMAIDALCQFPSEKEKVIPVLLSFIEDQDNNVWLGAAFGLEDILSPTEKRAQFVPALKRALNSPNETIRENAALFLDRIPAESASKE